MTKQIVFQSLTKQQKERFIQLFIKYNSQFQLENVTHTSKKGPQPIKQQPPQPTPKMNDQQQQSQNKILYQQQSTIKNKPRNIQKEQKQEEKEQQKQKVIFSQLQLNKTQDDRDKIYDNTQKNQQLQNKHQVFVKQYNIKAITKLLDTFNLKLDITTSQQMQLSLLNEQKILQFITDLSEEISYATAKFHTIEENPVKQNLLCIDNIKYDMQFVNMFANYLQQERGQLGQQYIQFSQQSMILIWCNSLNILPLNELKQNQELSEFLNYFQMEKTLTVGLYCAMCRLLQRENDKIDYLRYSNLLVGMLQIKYLQDDFSDQMKQNIQYLRQQFIPQADPKTQTIEQINKEKYKQLVLSKLIQNEGLIQQIFEYQIQLFTIKQYENNLALSRQASNKQIQNEEQTVELQNNNQYKQQIYQQPQFELQNTKLNFTMYKSGRQTHWTLKQALIRLIPGMLSFYSQQQQNQIKQYLLSNQHNLVFSSEFQQLIQLDNLIAIESVYDWLNKLFKLALTE